MTLFSNFQFNTSEKLSRKICCECQIRLDESYQFKCQVTESQSTLDSLLDSSSVEDLPDYCFGDYLKVLESEPTTKKSTENPPRYQDNRCPICGKHFKRKINIPIHIRRIHEHQRDHECDLCGYKCYKKYEMLLHHRNLHIKDCSDKVLCPECGRTMRNESDLRRHQQKQHLKIKRFQCESCNFTNFERSAIILHGKTHLPVESRDLHPCGNCGKVLSTKSTLKYHIESVHENLRSHVCNICSKSFSRKAGLTLHQKTVHEGVKEHQCDVCKIFVSQACYLKKHKRMMHPEDGRRIKYSCETCPQTFSTEHALKNHQTIHRDPEFECSQCFKKFYRKGNLQDHQEHHQVLEFPCEHCTRSFRKESKLLNHLKKVHFKERETYRCEVCQSTFTRRTTYRDHVMRQHKELDAGFRDQLVKEIMIMLPEEKLTIAAK